ncbi:MAG: DUF4115 domain-containing protein, partial [Planctomycetota bacterium]
HYYGNPPALPPGDSGADAGPAGPTGQATAEVSRSALGADDASAIASSPRALPTDQTGTPNGRPAKPGAVTRPPGHRRWMRWSTYLAITAAGLLVVLTQAVGYFGWRPQEVSSAGQGPAASLTAAAAAVVPSVTVRAVVKQPTDVRVERDGELLYEGPLAAGQQIWQGSKEISIWASRPEAIELTVNGKSIGPLGQEGDRPVSRRFRAGEGTEK